MNIQFIALKRTSCVTIMGVCTNTRKCKFGHVGSANDDKSCCLQTGKHGRSGLCVHSVRPGEHYTSQIHCSGVTFSHANPLSNGDFQPMVWK